MYQSGKLANVEAEMQRLKIQILGISDVRWQGSGKIKSEHGTIFYSGNENNDHLYGVAIMITSELEDSVIDYLPLGDRVIMLKLKTTHRNMNVIQAYAPTCSKSDDEVEHFYACLEEALKVTKKSEITIILGDFNAKVGEGSEGDIVGNFGLGERNPRGDRLVQFCNEHQFAITNTFFKLHPRRLYTWRSPADSSNHLVRNQIDFILIKTDLKKYVKATKTYPGADIHSDHNPVVMDVKLQRFTRVNRIVRRRRIDVRRLADTGTMDQISKRLEERMQAVTNTWPTDLNEQWKTTEKILTETQKMDVGYAVRRGKQKWMTDEILQMMDVRRKLKGRNNMEYSKMAKEIKKKCREEKENWLAEKCAEIEELQKKHDLFNIHKKVKELSGKQRPRHHGVLRDGNNKILIGITEKLKRWTEYVKNLFDDERSNEPPSPNELNETSPLITTEEVRKAIQIQKNGKAVGPDLIHIETLKLLAYQEGEGLKLLTSLYNTIYRTGEIPTDWLRSTFIPLPKKVNASLCDDYRLISLMSHILKVFLRIIHTRIYKKCEQQIDPTQFGFRNGVGTREAIFSLNVLAQRCRDVNVDIYACFIDYRKAFDCVSHNKMASILKSSGIDAGDLCIITNLYWRQNARMRVEETEAEEIEIRRGVRQGCVLSPLLFNLYSEAIFKEALEDCEEGVRINGRIINNIRYADDTVIMADNLPGLQLLMDRIAEISGGYGLHMNIKKTKLILFSKTPRRVDLRIGGETVEQVTCYKYLGILVNQQCDPGMEIKARIEMARATFASMKKMFTSRSLSLPLRIRMVRCYVFPVLLYGCEGWTLSPALDKKIDAFEMYVYRRMLRISWVEKRTNEDVLLQLNKNRELLNTIKERKLGYIGHVMRAAKYDILQLIIEGKINGKRSVGRRQNSWMKDLRRWYCRTSADIFRAAVSKITIAKWIADLRTERA